MYLQNNLRQWEAAVVSAAVPLVSKIFGGGESSAEKKAASMARRSADAQKVMSLFFPFSDLVDDARWEQISSAVQQAMTVGVNGTNIATLLVRGTPYVFAKQATDVILATPPSAMIRKTGGYPMWTGLQNAVRTAFSQRKPDVPTPTAPALAPTPFQPTSTTPYTFLTTRPSYEREEVPYNGRVAPQIITIPAPTTMFEEPAPTQLRTDIDPTWLIWGALGFVALTMLRK